MSLISSFVIGKANFKGSKGVIYYFENFYNKY